MTPFSSCILGVTPAPSWAQEQGALDPLPSHLHGIGLGEWLKVSALETAPSGEVGGELSSFWSLSLLGLDYKEGIRYHLGVRN